MENYKNTLFYGGLGYAAGNYLLRWSPNERISPAAFWALMGAGYGMAVDTGKIGDDENPKRPDVPTFNFTEPYKGGAA